MADANSATAGAARGRIGLLIVGATVADGGECTGLLAGGILRHG
jgi:hypothetical protein